MNRNLKLLLALSVLGAVALAGCYHEDGTGEPTETTETTETETEPFPTFTNETSTTTTTTTTYPTP